MCVTKVQNIQLPGICYYKMLFPKFLSGQKYIKTTLKSNFSYQILKYLMIVFIEFMEYSRI